MTWYDEYDDDRPTERLEVYTQDEGWGISCAQRDEWDLIDQEVKV